jgi:hypothetical protein
MAADLVAGLQSERRQVKDALAVANAATVRLNDYFTALAGERRGCPRDDRFFVVVRVLAGPAAGSVLGCQANSKRSGTGFVSSRLLATGSGFTRRAILRLRYVVRRANWLQSFSGWPTTV